MCFLDVQNTSKGNHLLKIMNFKFFEQNMDIKIIISTISNIENSCEKIHVLNMTDIVTMLSEGQQQQQAKS